MGNHRPNHIIFIILVIAAASLQVGPSQASTFQTHSPILINGNQDFTFQNGVRHGNGTIHDPYMIEGWVIGASSATGIEILNTDANFAVDDVQIRSGKAGNYDGIRLFNVTNGKIEDSVFFDNMVGVSISYSKDVAVVDNRFPYNEKSGVSLLFSRRITVSANTFDSSGLYLYGDTSAHFDTQNITQDNLVNGKTLYYHRGCNNPTVDRASAGQVIIASCSGGRIANLMISDTTVGIELAFVKDTFVMKNSLLPNKRSSTGILILYSAGVTVTGNSLSSKRQGSGLSVEHSTNTTISYNNFLNNTVGINLAISNFTRVSGNNFLHNSQQAYNDQDLADVWNSDYPIGGNYWSEYDSADKCSGPSQNICGAPDGIGDIPYRVDSANFDRYPLMLPNDDTPPSWPPNALLSFSDLGPTGLRLGWEEALDNVEVANYRIFEEGRVLDTLPSTARDYAVAGLRPGNTYTFTVLAADEKGQWSTWGPSVTLTIPKASISDALYASTAIGSAGAVTIALYLAKKMKPSGMSGRPGHFKRSKGRPFSTTSCKKPTLHTVVKGEGGYGRPGS